MRLHTFLAAGLTVLATFSDVPAKESDTGTLRRITVKDGIELTSLADPNYFNGVEVSDRVALFSPDGKQFAVVLRRGDVQEAVNVFDLLIFRSQDAVRDRPEPIRRLSMKSSSDRPAIDVTSLEWSSDGRSVTFIGETPGTVAQVMRMTVASGEVVTLSHSESAVLSYSLGEEGSGTLVYVTEGGWRDLWNASNEQAGVVVSNQSVPDLLTGRDGYAFRGLQDEYDLYLEKDRIVRQLRTDHHVSRLARPALSPDGRFVAIMCVANAQDITEEWRRYPFAWLKAGLVRASVLKFGYSLIQVHVLIDLQTGENRKLLDVPVSNAGTAPVWVSPKAVVVESPVPGQYVDPGVVGVLDSPLPIEVDTESGRIRTIGKDCREVVEWDEARQRLKCHAERPDGALEPRETFYRRAVGSWKRDVRQTAQVVRPVVYIREDFRTPPRLLVSDGQSGREKVLLDLNPQLDRFALGHAEEIRWRLASGRAVRAGLFYPLDYEPGRRYPLVIQTHAWTPKRFHVDGPFSTGYAIQALAARGFFVLQVEDEFADLIMAGGGREDVETAMEIYHSVIDILVNRGFVDRARVGILGFSHTCFYAKYALAHHPDLFAAATVSEGEDGSYLQYVARSGSGVNEDDLYGGGPHGEFQKVWLERSPSFNLSSVRAPLRITTLHPHFLLADWEWLVGLRDLGKPVDLVLLKNGKHVLQKPLERLSVGEGNVDWFDFWLNGHEDSEPSKAAQYERWRGLRSSAVTARSPTDLPH